MIIELMEQDFRANMKHKFGSIFLSDATYII